MPHQANTSRSSVARGISIDVNIRRERHIVSGTGTRINHTLYIRATDIRVLEYTRHTGKVERRETKERIEVEHPGKSVCYEIPKARSLLSEVITVVRRVSLRVDYAATAWT